jgi:hypothetical protein
MGRELMDKKPIVGARINLNDGTLTLDDQWLGKRTLDGSALSTIRDQLKLLLHYRRDGRKPSRQLLDDIKVYKYILSREDCAKAADDYLSMASQMREEQETISVAKMDIAKRLGWNVR